MLGIGTLKNRFLLSIALLMIFGRIIWGNVIVNEILYHDSAGDLEFIELHNTATTPVDVSGWVLKDNLDTHEFRFPAGISIPANGYFVIANDNELFSSTYGFYPTLNGISFNFSNDGDTVRLFNAAKQLVDSVDYDDRSPWPDAADGGGASLERINPEMPKAYSASWAASAPKGTPGKKNSTYTDQLSPLIVELDHTPKIPAPNRSITVTARVLDIAGGLQSVKLYYGWNAGLQYQSVSMIDDGQHNDANAKDGIYGATVNGSQAGGIFRFYVQAQDANGQSITLPVEGRDEPYLTVVESALSGERVSVHRIVMRPEVNARFLQRYQTDEYFPATFYDGDKVYYRIHARHRGRSRIQNGRFKLRFPHQQLYRNSMRRLNYNGTDSATILREYLSFQLYQDVGLPNMETELVRLHINGGPGAGTPYRVAIENPDSQFLRRRGYFARDDGNLYKTTLDGTPQNKATWRYIGDNPDLYRDAYLKQTNEEQDDYSDIIEFCRVLSEADPEDPNFLLQVNSVFNTEDFIRWMAVSACVAHWDSPFTDHAHNYVLYNNPATKQFHILAWDLNGTFSYTSNPEDLNYRKLYTHIRSTKYPAINKILNHPVLGAQYYREIDSMMETYFSSENMTERINEARDALRLGDNSVSFLRTYVTRRRQDMAAWINQKQGAAFLTKPTYQASVGEPYRYHAVAVDYREGKPVVYSLMQGPAWLQVNPSTGELAGTPPQQGRYEIALQASIGNQSIEQSYTLQAVDSTPRLILNFNEPSGNALDTSPFAHKGRLAGGATRVDGRLGKALSLSGSTMYVEFPHHESLNLSGGVTVEAWIRPNSIGNGNPVILSKGDADTFNYTLMLGYGPWNWDAMEPGFMPHRFDIENRVYYGRKDIEARLQNRRWAHIAGTYDSAGELVCVYANNRRIVESSSRAQMVENLRPLRIGLGTNRNFQGLVDDIKVLPFAKQAFAVGLCLSQVDVSGLSPAQDRIALTLSPLRSEPVNTGDYCLYLVSTNRWLAFPTQTLAPGATAIWWLDDLGLDVLLLSSETVALYPKSVLGKQGREWILDQVAWGDTGPEANDPGVQAAVWLPGRSVKLISNQPTALSLRGLADNDEMDADWLAGPQGLTGPGPVVFTINDGVPIASRQTVQLQIDAPAVQTGWKMRLANDPSLKTQWIPYSSNFTWDLLSGDGLKTIYLQLVDTSGNRSPVYQSTIRLESETHIREWREIE